MEQRELTYGIDFEVTQAQEAVIAAAFQQWEEALGIPIFQVEHAKNATIVVQEGELEGDLVGYAQYYSKKAFNIENGRNQEVLDWATITSEESVWDTDKVLEHYLHEIAHIFAKGEHTNECPATMHPVPEVCGLPYIDAATLSKARGMVAEGWLEKPEENSLGAILNPLEWKTSGF